MTMARRGSLEHEIQKGFVDWFSLQYPRYRMLLFAVPNGGRRDSVTGSMLKAEGVTAGVSDLILFIPRKGYHGLCIETKTPKKTSRQSPSQKEWQKAVEEQGYKYEVCRSIDEFMATVNEYLS